MMDDSVMVPMFDGVNNMFASSAEVDFDRWIGTTSCSTVGSLDLVTRQSILAVKARRHGQVKGWISSSNE